MYISVYDHCRRDQPADGGEPAPEVREPQRARADLSTAGESQEEEGELPDTPARKGESLQRSEVKLSCIPLLL